MAAVELTGMFMVVVLILSQVCAPPKLVVMIVSTRWLVGGVVLGRIRHQVAVGTTGMFHGCQQLIRILLKLLVRLL